MLMIAAKANVNCKHKGYNSLMSERHVVPGNGIQSMFSVSSVMREGMGDSV